MDKFKIFVIVAIVLLAAGIGAGIFLIMGMQQTKEAQAPPQEYEVPAEELELIYLSEIITANLALTEDQIPHMARMSVAFRIHNKAKDYADFLARFTADEVIVRNHIISALRSMTYEDMNEIGAQERLALILKDEINALFDTTIIQDIYFGELFVQ